MISQDYLTSEPLYILAGAERALFPRIGTQASPFTFPVMPPTAADGFIKNIHYKPEMDVIVDAVSVLEPIRTRTIALNGITKATDLHQTNTIKPVQYVCTVIDRPRYLIKFRIRTTTDHNFQTLNKHVDMMKRRLRKEQCFRDPYFGSKPFQAWFNEIENPDDYPPEKISIDIGQMTLKRVWSEKKYPGTKCSVRIDNHIMFHARLDRGVLHVPDVQVTSHG